MSDLRPGQWVKMPPKSGRVFRGPYWSAKVLEVRADGFVKVTLRGPAQAYWIEQNKVQEDP